MTNEKLNINEWAAEDRPRERLERLGAEYLSNAELLAILIGSGNARQTAVDLMKQVLGDCNNNLNSLGKLTIEDLQKYNGIGPAKAITILAACELGKRRAKEKAEERQIIETASDIYNLMHPRMQDLSVEEGWILLMNQRLKLIESRRISSGGFTETAIDVRVILREAILKNATVLAICHNHPSGNASPSRADDQLTQRIQKACQLMRIHFLDHVIVCDGRYFSYREEDRL